MSLGFASFGFGVGGKKKKNIERAKLLPILRGEKGKGGCLNTTTETNPDAGEERGFLRIMQKGKKRGLSSALGETGACQIVRRREKKRKKRRADMPHWMGERKKKKKKSVLRIGDWRLGGEKRGGGTESNPTDLKGKQGRAAHFSWWAHAKQRDPRKKKKRKREGRSTPTKKRKEKREQVKKNLRPSAWTKGDLIDDVLGGTHVKTPPTLKREKEKEDAMSPPDIMSEEPGLAAIWPG